MRFMPTIHYRSVIPMPVTEQTLAFGLSPDGSGIHI